MSRGHTITGGLAYLLFNSYRVWKLVKSVSLHVFYRANDFSNFFDAMMANMR